ncbi:MAG: LysM domain-containing protein, partial [Bacteroidia bacterium]|nr:LysM domain-containing protein [Bacteroidia bacterium]
IAMRTGVSVSRLCSLNGIRRSSLLRVGRKLRYT